MAWAEVGAIGATKLYGTYSLEGALQIKGSPNYFAAIHSIGEFQYSYLSNNDIIKLGASGCGDNNGLLFMGIWRYESSISGLSISPSNLHAWYTDNGNVNVYSARIEGLASTLRPWGALDIMRNSGNYNNFKAYIYYIDANTSSWTRSISEVSSAFVDNNQITNGFSDNYCFLFTTSNVNYQVYVAFNLKFNLSEPINVKQYSPVFIDLVKCNSTGVQIGTYPFYCTISKDDQFVNSFKRVG